MHFIYWLSTLAVSAMLLASSFAYIFHQATIDGVRELGFPDFFRIQLAVLKLLAVIVLLTPGIPLQVKEWAYAGVGLFLVTAIVAHLANKDPIFLNLLNLVFMALLVVSNLYLKRYL